MGGGTQLLGLVEWEPQAGESMLLNLPQACGLQEYKSCSLVIVSQYLLEQVRQGSVETTSIEELTRNPIECCI